MWGGDFAQAREAVGAAREREDSGEEDGQRGLVEFDGSGFVGNEQAEDLRRGSRYVGIVGRFGRVLVMMGDAARGGGCAQFQGV